ncbi:MAG: transcriptional regulator [Novosphingobium sp.]
MPVKLDQPFKGQPLADSVFDNAARARFSTNYPEVPHNLTHKLRDNPLLALEALAQLGEMLPASQIEYNSGDLPIGITAKPGANGLTIGETIRQIDTCRSWAVLKNIQQVPAYAALLDSLLAEPRPDIEAKTGAMLTPQGFIFVSSPDAVTPYHFDPEHNILLQLRGSKVMTQFPAGNALYAPDTVHETYHSGGGRELIWCDELATGGTDFALEPGDAVFVPVMAPHYVRVGPQPSISLSITWRSEWSYAEADARVFNRKLRALGLTPRAPGRWPATNRGKALAWRICRRLGVAE